MKLIICDKNKELIKKIKEANIKPFRNRFEIEIICDNVLNAKDKYPNAKICTASNPKFTAGAGLDKTLKEKYPDEWNNLKEFRWTENLFPIISVNYNLEATEEIIERGLIGVFAYLYRFDFILTGIGTAIGGLDIDIFVKKLIKIFSSANLSNSDLRNSNLRNSDLSYSNLSYSDLRNSDLSYSNLSYSDLRNSNLRNSNLSYSDLRNSDLSYSNLRNSNLSYSDLRNSNLSSCKNMVDNTEEILSNFKFNKKGLIVYKGIGNTTYRLNPNWKIEKGSYLTEIVNPCKNCACGCGVNFGTIEYIKNNYPKSEIWECLIEFKDLVNVVIPYNSDGKGRCSRLKLIKKIKEVKQ